jgi:hypothetical protein
MAGVADMTDRTLVFEDFADKVGEVFPICDEGVPAIPLILQEAEPLDPAVGLPGVRPPFSLIFLGRDPRVLPQGVYLLEHQELGKLSIFLVPVGKDKDGVSYQAAFN